MRDPFRAICDDELERRWIWISLIMAFVMGGLLGVYAVASNIHPPSNVETIDSSRLHLSEEFAEDNLGVKENADGSLTVTMVAARYGFYPPVSRCQPTRPSSSGLPVPMCCTVFTCHSPTQRQ